MKNDGGRYKVVHRDDESNVFVYTNSQISAEEYIESFNPSLYNNQFKKDELIVIKIK